MQTLQRSDVCHTRSASAQRAAWGQPRPPCRTSLSFAHQFVGRAPVCRSRTSCIGCAAEEVVRRRGSSAPPKKWCGSAAPAALRPRGQVVRRRGRRLPAPVGGSRTSLASAHRLHRVRGRGIGAPPSKWCAAEEVVRECRFGGVETPGQVVRRCGGRLPAPVGGSRTSLASAHRLQRVRRRATGAPPRK
jgi:hypothetical protein